MIKNRKSKLVILSGLVSLLLTSLAWSSKNDLGEVAFESFKSKNPVAIFELLMTESRYRTMTGGNDDSMTKPEYELAIRNASGRAVESAKKSFRDIQHVLDESGFEWSTAELIRIEVPTFPKAAKALRHFLFEWHLPL